MMDFLYFPEDKSEYIPALLAMLPFLLGAVLTFLWIIRVSKKQEARLNEAHYTTLSQVKKASDTGCDEK
ncbi:hypothetical protein [Domibacillus robiginosus]|uniref:hypothetical protein n=1 Tax=Domibacillus robiginosus TaxID=1071054 RepID=UPI00067BFC41|nr:hypothetical protein [Domibacillus robiginosus]